ncbi:uncharacterized protein LOC111196881 [Astyanax mexicanus]|uniref:uncharacterized protein LOC111196881 n=1 Tax=Astyanax mexicanus TaxID=7994 RepID=UPI0020CAAE9B|nr:uncharacterized protein LOC111196881 [Astyanax mexicanus]
MNLKIINTVEEDAGTYFCVKVKDQVVEFGSGTLLLFSGETSRKRNLTEIKVKTGESVTLQCSVLMATLSCSGDHSVYWFRPDSGEPLPGIIFTHGDSSSPCTRSSETVSPTQSCIYKLPKNNLSLSDAGTYYCAVAACGEILYGTGTKLHVKDNGIWIVTALMMTALSVVSCFVIMVLVVLLINKQEKGFHHPSHTKQPYALDHMGGSVEEEHDDENLKRYRTMESIPEPVAQGALKDQIP